MSTRCHAISSVTQDISIKPTRGFGLWILKEATKCLVSLLSREFVQGTVRNENISFGKRR